EPLLAVLAKQEDAVDSNDWIVEEVQVVLGMIGPPAKPALAARLAESSSLRFLPLSIADALVEMAKRIPDGLKDIVTELASFLNTAAANDPEMNGWIIAHLIKLAAVEAWPAIEKAFATGNVDDTIAGDAPHVKGELGLGPKTKYSWRCPPISEPTAKDRAQERAKKRKAEKRTKRRTRH